MSFFLPGSRVIRMLADNPSPLTLEGTNSYLILGEGEALAIDPGPVDPAHVAALIACAAGHACRIAAIAVTHGHPDHYPAAALLAQRTGAPVYAHPTASYPFDCSVRDGERIDVRGAGVIAYETPGHASDHVAFWLEAETALFAGDVILGRGTVVIVPPDGEMRAYQATLRRLRDQFAHTRTIYCGHGEPVAEPLAKIEEYLAHREAREEQITAALAAGERTLSELVADVYRATAAALQPLAAQQIRAYLIALEREGRVSTIHVDGAGSERYALTD